MRHIGFLAIMATVLLLSSCSYKSKETVLENGMIAFSAQTQKDNKNIEVWGVKDKNGKVIIPAKYEKVFMDDIYLVAYEDYSHQWYHNADGTKLLDKPVSYSFTEDSGVRLSVEDGYYYVFRDNGKISGPWKDIDTRKFFTLDAVFTESDSLCTIHSLKGVELVSANKLIFLHSRADQKDYYLCCNDGKWTAYSTKEDGSIDKELFAVDEQRLEKLPKPSWICEKELKIISTINPIEVFKSGKTGKTSKKKK